MTLSLTECDIQWWWLGGTFLGSLGNEGIDG